MEKGYWDRVRKGDEQAFMKMYDAYYQFLYSFGYRIYPDKEMVKDAIHEIYCEIWEKRFDLPEVRNEKSYLFTYLKRKILKEAGMLEKIADLESTLTDEHAVSYEELLIQSQTTEENKARLKNLLSRISPAQKQIITYKFFAMMSYEEIAEKMNLQPRTVYNQVYEALKTMRNHFKVLFSLFII